METPVINLDGLHGNNPEKKREVMVQLHEACEKWGFFQAFNHGIDEDLIEKFKRLVNLHYEEQMKPCFYQSDMAKGVLKDSQTSVNSSDADWESSFFVRHQPKSNIDEFTNLTDDLRKTMEEYVKQVTKLAETLLEVMSENLGLEKDYLKKQFAGEEGGPCIGTKVAKYPECPKPELVKGLREHTDAGGIIFLLQDDQVPGLQFLKDGQWVDIPPSPLSSRKSTIFVNTGDQLEVMSNGCYKSALHRVLATKAGSRLSIVTFYNPAANALIFPAPQLLYPHPYRFQDYLNLYATTKFSPKGARFQQMKKKMLLTESTITI
ncbi:1-aminocyclopropane-1-carboxylate oxidase 1 [Aristolochia californica]|uniref:1-aminocyclopropane-1-carboxylate oxidase 1 n=1 Tax=Aristolochia californica TaxID=171875 RepID=UPI0035E014F7